VDDREPSDHPAVEAFGLMAEPVRRALYEFVAARREPVDRDNAAAAVGVGRPLAAFHLERLARAGLLDVEYRRRTGRTGPGAGRPAKFYRARQDAIDLSIPPRRYALAAEIFAQALERTPDLGIAEVAEVARAHGRQLADDARTNARDGRTIDSAAAALRLLADLGFEPEPAGQGVRLRNCPFNALVNDHRPLSCGANLAMLSGLVAGLPEAGLTAEREETPGYCCVSFSTA